MKSLFWMILLLGICVIPIHAGAVEVPLPGTGGTGGSYTRTVTLNGKVKYNDQRLQGRFDFRDTPNGSAGKRPTEGGSNYLGMLDAKVEIYEIDSGTAGGSCVGQTLVGSAYVHKDGHFHWEGSVSDPCTTDTDGTAVSLAVRVVLRYCGDDASDGARCIAVATNVDDGSAPEDRVYGLWHSGASPANPVVVSTSGTTEQIGWFAFETSPGAADDNFARASNTFASLVDVTRVWHVNEGVPFRHAEHGDVYALVPSSDDATIDKDTIHLSYGLGWPDGRTALHEYGHILAHRSIGGNGNSYCYPEVTCDDVTAHGAEEMWPRAAFNEGFATFVRYATLSGIPAGTYGGSTPDSCSTHDADSEFCTAANGCADSYRVEKAVTLTLCDFFDDEVDDAPNRTGNGDHLTMSIFAAWEIMDLMITANPNAYSIPEDSLDYGLDLCDYADYYVNTAHAGSVYHAAATTNLLLQNGVICNL